MSKIKIVAHGPMGEKLVIDLCDTEEQLRNMTVKQLKEKTAVRLTEYGDSNPLRFLFKDEPLDEDSTLLSEYGIQNMSEIFVVMKLTRGDSF